MQFGHYEPFLQTVKGRGEDEGVFIAGTYARYFMQDQHATQYDHFMNSLWQWFSDGDASKILARLKDQKIRYIAIDPSIGTVVQNEGNVSLFERYFALVDRTNPNNKKTITQGGVMTTITDLTARGDMSYIHTNNLAIKY